MDIESYMLYSKPSDTLIEVMFDKGLSIKDVFEGYNVHFIHDFLTGRVGVPSSLAYRLEEQTGISWGFWIRKSNMFHDKEESMKMLLKKHMECGKESKERG